MAFDIFRFDAEGKIAEHCDNLAALVTPNPSGRTQIDGALEKTLSGTENTRKAVEGFIMDSRIKSQ